MSSTTPTLVRNGELKSPDIVCVRNLFVGTGTDGMGTSDGFGDFKNLRHMDTRPGVDLMEFKRELLSKVFGLDSLVPSKQLIVFLKKSGRRSLINLDEIVSKTRIVFSEIATIVSVDPSTISLDDQMVLVRNTTVLISTCGGSSLISLFQSPFTSRIVIDFFNVKTNKTGFAHALLWKYDRDVQTFYYPLERHEVELERKWPDWWPMYQLEYWQTRDFGRVKVDFEKLRPLIEDGLQRAGTVYGFPFPNQK